MLWMCWIDYGMVLYRMTVKYFFILIIFPRLSVSVLQSCHMNKFRVIVDPINQNYIKKFYKLKYMYLLKF